MAPLPRPPKACAPTLGVDRMPERRRVDTAIRRSEEHTSELQSLRHLVCPQTYTLSLHDALPISPSARWRRVKPASRSEPPKTRSASTTGRRARPSTYAWRPSPARRKPVRRPWEWIACQSVVGWTRRSGDRKSTRLNSSHLGISYALRLTLFPYTTLFRSHRLPGGAGSSPHPGVSPRRLGARAPRAGGPDHRHTHGAPPPPAESLCADPGSGSHARAS